jgi:ATP-dependent Clp protease protease subunit
MNQGKDFKKFANSMGINSMTLHDIQRVSDSYISPSIIEERKLNVAVMSVFDRLMMDRIIFLGTGIDDYVANVIQAQLLFLQNSSNDDVTIQLNSGGGSVTAGLAIIDVMNYVKSDIVTINTGMCASMASVILSSGTPGKRYALIHSKVMTHMVSHGISGNVQDTRIDQLEAEKYNYILFKNLAKNCKKPFDEVLNSSRHNNWFTSDEALNFGLIDNIIDVDENNNITKMLEGFDEYYNKEVLGK